jgi:hypothetical protein
MGARGTESLSQLLARGINTPLHSVRLIRMEQLPQSDAKGALQSGTIAARPNNISIAGHPARVLFLSDDNTRGVAAW